METIVAARRQKEKQPDFRLLVQSSWNL